MGAQQSIILQTSVQISYTSYFKPTLNAKYQRKITLKKFCSHIHTKLQYSGCNTSWRGISMAWPDITLTLTNLRTQLICVQYFSHLNTFQKQTKFFFSISPSLYKTQNTHKSLISYTPKKTFKKQH